MDDLEMDDLESRFIELVDGELPRREQVEDVPIISAEPYSCIIFTPDEASRWLTSEGGMREILSDQYIFERAQRDYFGEEFSIEIMNDPKVKNLFTQYYLNSKSESDKQIIKDAIMGMEASMGRGAAAGDVPVMPEGLTMMEQMRWRRINQVVTPERMSSGGGLKKKSRKRKSKKRKSKHRKSKTRRRRR